MSDKPPTLGETWRKMVNALKALDQRVEQYDYIPHLSHNKLYKEIKWSDEYGVRGWTRVPATKEDAEVVSSESRNVKNLHYPVLDIDLETWLLESSTPGHYHLFIEHQMSWREYKRLLKALAKARIIEKGYADACIRRKHSAVRVPWVRKETP